MKKKQLLFITSANLATNPRLVKEIDTLSSEYEIDVLLFNVVHWSSAIDEKMRAERSHLNFIKVDVSKRSFFRWAYWAFIEKLCRFLYPLLRSNLFILAGALSRKSIVLLRKFNSKSHYSLIIAHTLPALYPAYSYANRWGIPFAYDIEDYDPGMQYANAGRYYEMICKTLYRKLLPKAKYLTSASPLIGQFTLDFIGGHSNHQVLLNSFPQKEFNISIEKRNGVDDFSTIRFVWFSMTISFNRGLEQFFEAISIINLSGARPKCLFELTLIGNLQDDFDATILKPFVERLDSVKWFSLKVEKILPQTELHEALSFFDIGLAFEFDSSDLNRQLCLTNKLLAYTQAGVFILATDTPAQKLYMKENQKNGLLVDQTPQEIAKAIIDISERISEIKNTFSDRFANGQNIAWENQEKILKDLIGVAIG